MRRLAAVTKSASPACARARSQRGVPFFCMMMHVTTYLNGLFRAVNRLIQCSKQLDVHWLTCGVRTGH